MERLLAKKKPDHMWSVKRVINFSKISQNIHGSSKMHGCVGSSSD